MLLKIRKGICGVVSIKKSINKEKIMSEHEKQYNEILTVMKMLKKNSKGISNIIKGGKDLVPYRLWSIFTLYCRVSVLSSHCIHRYNPLFSELANIYAVTELSVNNGFS